jgi:Starch-binding associating with outer membrane
MKIVSKIIQSSLLVALVATSSCDKFTDFEDLNVSPNSPSVASTASLFTGAMTSVGGVATAITPALYTQQFGDVTYVEESRYKTVNFDYGGFYASPLNSLQYIIKLNTDAETKDAAAGNGSNANQIAVARILKAYFFLNITDRWGDVPYSQALKGKENFSPSFDTQQAIYNDLFKELKEAQAQFDGGLAVKGDIMLNGSATRWKKFANSLRAIMALRLSKVDPAKGKAEMTAALADGVFTSNADNVTYKYLKDANYESPLYNNYVTGNRKDFAVSNVLIDYLVKTADPRIAAYADKATATLTYKGVPYGVFPSPVKAQDVSLASASKVAAQDAAVNVATYAQILFTQAEAAKLGWISGSAKQLYEDAIKASMQQWGVHTEAAFNSFITSPDIAYDDAKALQLIGTQKWVALYYMGYEAWAEWRRTGFPALTPAAKPLNVSGQIPRRMAYPTTEATLNKVNYDAAVARQGADNQETRVWWDKK